MNKKAFVIVCVILVIGLWRYILPLIVLAGVIGGALYLFERLTGIYIFSKPRGG